jgi:methylated-DNA-[protein]-cysteine S-methyltransferase
VYIDIYYYDSPFGEMILGSYGDKLCLADWKNRRNRETIDRRVQRSLNAEYRYSRSEVIEKTMKQLEEYFALKRQSFEIPLHFTGTAFQKRVWDQLKEIPYGGYTSYKALAREIGNSNAVRAVASANGANAISILVPCHRVIGNDGTMKGYAGGTEIKKKLLELEQKCTY